MENNTWWLIFAMAAGVGIFLSLLLITHTAKPKHGTKSLGLLIFVFSLTLIQYVLIWSGSTPKFPHLGGLWMASNYIYGPLLLPFFFEKKSLDTKKWAWHFIPAIFLFIMWIPFGLLPGQEKIEWMQQTSPFDTFLLPNRNFLWLLHPYFMIGGQLIYSLFFLHRAFRKNQKENSFRHLIAYLFAAFALANASYFILINTPNFTLLWDYLISLAMTLCIFRLGLVAFHQPSNFFISDKVSEIEKYASSSLTKNKSLKLADRIRELVESHKSYLNAELRLSSLAEKLEVPPQHVSQAVNEQFGCSFSEWVNQYRIEHACQLLKQGANAKEAGYQSGFNNLSTFYQVFKRKQGMTPAVYKHSLTSI